MRAAENPTATATFQNVTDQTDNAQLRSKKTPPDLNYTAGSKPYESALQICFRTTALRKDPHPTAAAILYSICMCVLPG